MVHKQPVHKKKVTALYSFLLSSSALQGRWTQDSNLLCERISAMSIQKAELPSKHEVTYKCENSCWFQTPNLKIRCLKQAVGNLLKRFKSTVPDQKPQFSVRWCCISLERYNEVTWCKWRKVSFVVRLLDTQILYSFCFNWTDLQHQMNHKDCHKQWTRLQVVYSVM
jgi:hypothetical protein